jgi:hypothetical protein
MKRILLCAALVAVSVVFLVGGSSALAQSGNMWRIDYFNNPNWAGAPVQTDFNSWIAFNWGLGSPGPAVPVDNFSARMTTDAFFPGGIYQFSAVADDEMVLIIDGVTQLDTRGRGQSGKSSTLNIPLTQGVHRLEVLYREFTLDAYVFLSWALTNNWVPPMQPVPPIGLPYPPLPPSQPSVQTSRGDYTPCIQQNLHQANCFVSDGAWDGPNQGSIALEPQIVVWTNCTPDTISTFWTTNNEARSFACSRTAAGWFPR